MASTTVVPYGGGGSSLPFEPGYIFITFSQTHPASIFGGDWEPIEGKFLFASSSFLAAERAYVARDQQKGSGGAATVTLSSSQIPSHSHTTGLWYSSGSGSSQAWQYSSSRRVSTHYTANPDGGSGAAHNNMPPYLPVNVWRYVGEVSS